MIPSSTTGVCKRPVAMATVSMLASCAVFLRDGKPVVFTAATCNVHCMERGIPGQIRTIKGLDVVAMQEVLSTGGQSPSAQIAASPGYHHVASILYVNYGSAQWVVAILSRHLIVARNGMWLGNSPQALRAVVNMACLKNA